jgi:hypothetical protein
MSKTLTSSKKYVVIVTKGNNLVERGEFFSGGAGLSIAIEDEDLRAQVESGVRFLIDEPAAVSCELLCGWEVGIIPTRR